MAEIAEMLAKPVPSCIIAAAGCGKTEEIVKAVGLSEGRQLILTHTNAGITSLRMRLKKYSIASSKYSIDTIASWFLKYTCAYPLLSGLGNSQPEGNGWDTVYEAAERLFEYRFIRNVLLNSYSGIYVDEYQDCTVTQHNLLMRLAEVLPVRVLGDPLQGIFGFKPNDPLVNWEKDVLSNFKLLPRLDFPWRWKGKNEILGLSLIGLRHSLESGDPVDVETLKGIEWFQLSDENLRRVCFNSLRKTGTVVGIHTWRDSAHQIARRLGGAYLSMEEMECKDLLFWCRVFEKNQGINLVIKVLKFAELCMVTHQQLIDYHKIIGSKQLDRLVNPPLDRKLSLAILALATSNDLAKAIEVLDAVRNLPNVSVFRRELFREMKRSIRAYLKTQDKSLTEIAWQTRYQTKVIGRLSEQHIISRTLLIKGLEYDHAILLDGDKVQDKMNFYVAVTRGSASLTILSSSPVFKFR